VAAVRAARACAALAALTLLCGCAVAPRQQGPSAAPPAWLTTPAVWRIRQVVLIEIGAAKFPVQGLLEVDTAAGTARLAALDDFGVTLFRLSLDRAGEKVDFILPVVPRGEDVVRSVAASLRRVYLEAAGDGVHREAGPDGGVASAHPSGNDSWQVWYADYGDAGGVPVPRLIRYRERGGASLTIRQESVKRVEK
jgi:hypothetical protein